jgi:hypothetical protein
MQRTKKRRRVNWRSKNRRGDDYSEKIIERRPYQRKDERVQKKILLRATYEGIKYKIVAKRK